MADDSYLARRLLETGNLSQAALKALLAEQEEARVQGVTPPPLEDLSPLLPRKELRENMIIGMHPKSEGLC